MSYRNGAIGNPVASFFYALSTYKLIRRTAFADPKSVRCSSGGREVPRQLIVMFC
ncbi:hypothetical protein RSSM_03539 [Rhodopirellula sallentina SM41]|uniref:Uncharacterized protein n=1 Tax=Rhodopirellula sallentina SM41 TaxID=1263870 RepID=M5UG91_9BACT|nr:hypothetical protein RSSM_03539 [Rhodopirellula sallentina SM41]